MVNMINLGTYSTRRARSKSTEAHTMEPQLLPSFGKVLMKLKLHEQDTIIEDHR